MPEKKLKVYEIVVYHEQLHTKRLFLVPAYSKEEAQKIYIRAQGSKNRIIESVKCCRKKQDPERVIRLYERCKEMGWVND